VQRDLTDASLELLSPDRRFATAYNAVLQTAKMGIAAAGYRVIGPGHHQTTFQALELAMGGEIRPLTHYFDTCRRKRNIVDYDDSEVASETEADELLRYAQGFHERVERWIAEHHPGLGR